MSATYTLMQLCREFDVTPRALRFYETKGLLSPSRDGERRIFGPTDRARLALVLRGKRFGFKLNEIACLLDLYDRDDSQVTQLRETISAAEHRLNEMRAQRDELNLAIEDLASELDHSRKMLTEREKSAPEPKKKKVRLTARPVNGGDTHANL